MAGNLVRSRSWPLAAFGLGLLCMPTLGFAQRVASASSSVAADRSAVRVTINVERATLPSVLTSIASQAGLTPMYDATLLPRDTRVTLHVREVPASDAFSRALAGTGLIAKVLEEGQVLILRGDAVAQASGVIAGRVVNASTNQPIVGATILVGDATKGVVTKEDGTYRLPLSPGEYAIRVRMVGFTRASQRVMVRSDQTVTANFAMQPSTSVLDEVVVTGTVVATERKAIANPITVITAAEIEQRGITRIEQLLRGAVPGVFALDPGTSSYNGGSLEGIVLSNVYSRGPANLGNEGSPLKTYVDGIEILSPLYLGTIDPKSIERIEIITGPQAATVYGSGAMGGVIQIFTKKGAGRTTPDLTLTLRYGALETNVSNGHTPTHNDVLNVSGGLGPEFSYAGSFSYNYQGQWQPKLFSRTYGASVGATYTRGSVTASGSVSAARGQTGTYESGQGLLGRTQYATGEFVLLDITDSPRRSKTASQTVAFNVDYRPFSWWQYHLTTGTSQTNLGQIPLAAGYRIPSDSMFRISTAIGSRTTLALNTTLTSPPMGLVSSTLTLGMTGSSGDQLRVDGCMPIELSSSLSGCGGGTVGAYRPILDKSYGGLGSWQIGFADRLYLTFGLRGERNPSYGQEHKIDWTPSTGAAYTLEMGALTLKMLGSYGRATRAPSPTYRLETFTVNVLYEPSRYLSRVANPLLKPEVSRGPQGGFELYYGNVGSLTMNRYSQTVSDLIQYVTVDSIARVRLSDGVESYVSQSQYQNVAKVRQSGWEFTGSLNAGPLSFRGTYSWMDSYVLAIPRGSSSVRVGQKLQNSPSHIGNVTLGYALGGTSLALVTNYRGSSISPSSRGQTTWGKLASVTSLTRIQQYVERYRTPLGESAQPGYVKSDFAASQRMNGWATLTVNIENLGNSFGTEATSALDPSLGRKTNVGMTIRLPRR